jgi:hypothetical protein
VQLQNPQPFTTRADKGPVQSRQAPNFRCLMSLPLLLLLALPQHLVKPPDTTFPKVSCVMHNIGALVYRKEEKVAEEIDDWKVDCSLEYQGKVIYHRALPLPSPANFHEATEAIEEFRNVRARELLKLYRAGKLEKGDLYT